MEINGFNGDEISEQSKENLQSETWQILRESQIKHYTAEQTAENNYGDTWDQVVKEYLRTGYKDESGNCEITVLDVAYKVLKRRDITVFYDADGNTLFDVENKRLEKEYGCVVLEEKNAVPDDPDAIKKAAKEKLEKEMKAAKDKTFAEPVIDYLLKRCEEDLGLAQDVLQEHKAWKKCFEYIYSQARKQSKGNCAAVRDDVVYEWAEDYYHKDDKAEEEKKAKEAAERKKKQEERAKKAKSEPKKAETPKPKEEPKPKKNSKDMDGQLDMFSIMGM